MRIKIDSDLINLDKIAYIEPDGCELNLYTDCENYSSYTFNSDVICLQARDKIQKLIQPQLEIVTY